MRRTRAFSVVELLVVVTVMVVLLALLMPALDQAIYQAELAVCGTRLRAIGSAATLYAAGQRRYYPHRAQFSEPGAGWHTPLLYNGDDVVTAAVVSPGSVPKKFDDRELLRSILAPLSATLNDPLARSIDIENFAANAYGYSSYTRWLGWAYRIDNNSLAGMIKLGDQLEWIDESREHKRSDILAQDHDIVNINNGDSQSAHPDKTGSTTPLFRQNQTFSVAGYPMNTTASFWRGANGRPRGPNDLQYAYVDGSVGRQTDVKHHDERMGFASYHSITDGPWRETLPVR